MSAPKTQLTPIPKRGPRNAFTRTVARLSNWDLLSMFDPKRSRPFPREVYINQPLPHHATKTSPTIPLYSSKQMVKGSDGVEREIKVRKGWGTKTVPADGWIFESNQVLTSKYNFVTFLPRNLLEQFRRVANCFFLALVILQFFPRFATVSPALAALPLIVVLAITAIKDGYEDVKRHQSDRAINGIKVLALRGTFHNPNVNHPKSTTLGLPGFIRNYFLRKSLVEDADDEEERQTERKKGFWGKKSFKRPKMRVRQNANGSGSGIDSLTEKGQEPQLPIDAPGGGSLQAAQAEANSGGSPGTRTPTKGGLGNTATGAGGAFSTPKVPERHERMAGDFYADDVDSGANGSTDVQSHHRQGPHLPGRSPQYDKPIWVEECWEDLRVGDFVRLRGDESVPADIIVCATSEEENVCYVETKNLDGETNLKSRHAVPELTHLNTSSAISNPNNKLVIEAETADVNMFSYNAAVLLLDGQTGKDGKALKCAVTLNTVLLRGTVVRNTDWVVGVVVMTGRDSKIVLNSGGTPSKRSKVERQMNPMVLLNLALLGAMCTMCAVVDHFLQKHYYPEGAYWLFRDDQSDDNPNINALITFGNALICFQNIVPISLYISIEFVRLLQAFFIWADDEILYRSGDTKRRTMAKSWNLSDDLGQIEYVFSDKTGTLTQNAMLFRQCSIGGKVYRGDDLPSDTTVVPKDAKPDIAASSSSDEDGTRVPAGSRSNSDLDNEKGSNGDGKMRTKLADQVLAPFHDSEIEKDLSKPESAEATRIKAFFSNLALCHTVLAAEDDGLISYKAQSPDEAALVQAAADVGYVFLGRDKNILNLQTPDDDDVLQYELLNVLEFTSARKRMSVVLRKVTGRGKDQGKLILFTKGADNVIFERLAAGDESLKKTTDSHLEEFANEGLRTLCLAYRPVEEEEYDAWEQEFHTATTLIDGRDEAIEKVSEKLETNLRLLGATAIEDRLQDGVPEAIADLKRAGLKIWVATGDKLETAIAIGKTCNLLSPDMNVIIIKGGEHGQPNSAYDQIKSALGKFFDAKELAEMMENQPPGSAQPAPNNRRSQEGRRPGLTRAVTGISGITDIVGEDNGERPGGYGLVIDGSSLRHAFAEVWTKDLLLELATRCKAVICCRTSPLQKALIVRLVKDGLGAMCLAIGDGANDVSMIQAADIGVGVAGEEGLQAVNSSDYAIGQFRFLQRLLLVHGHWSYMRNSNMIVNFFYKEIIGIGILFWFQFYCGYSATTVYEYTYLLFWNVFWTLAPVIAIGVFDRNIADNVLMHVPELYRYGRAGRLFGLKRFCVYMLDGIFQSAVIYFILLYTYDTTTARKDGYDIQLYEFSIVMAISAVIVANAYNGLNTRSWNWWVLAAVLLGPFLVLLWTAVYSALPPSFIWSYAYGNNHFLWPSAYFWLGLLITFVVPMIPRYLYRFYQENYFATDIDILTWISKTDPKHDWDNDPAMPSKVAQQSLFTTNTSEHSITTPIIDRRLSQRSYPPPRQSISQRDSFRLGRVSTQQSVTHDMSTGSAVERGGRGYIFDQSDNMVPPSIARYSSRTSEQSQPRTRPRKGSVRLGNLELNPFLRTPGRDRSASMRLFGRKTAPAVDESEEQFASTSASASPSKGSPMRTPLG